MLAIALGIIIVVAIGIAANRNSKANKRSGDSLGEYDLDFEELIDEPIPQYTYDPLRIKQYDRIESAYRAKRIENEKYKKVIGYMRLRKSQEKYIKSILSNRRTRRVKRSEAKKLSRILDIRADYILGKDNYKTERAIELEQKRKRKAAVAKEKRKAQEEKAIWLKSARESEQRKCEIAKQINQKIAEARRKENESIEREKRRPSIPCVFTEKLTEEDFIEIVQSAAKTIKRKIYIQISGPIVEGTVTSQSGITTWKFELDFNDFGKVTGNCWTWSENEDSSIPETLMRRIQNKIYEKIL